MIEDFLFMGWIWKEGWGKSFFLDFWARNFSNIIHKRTLSRLSFGIFLHNPFYCMLLQTKEGILKKFHRRQPRETLHKTNIFPYRKAHIMQNDSGMIEKGKFCWARRKRKIFSKNLWKDSEEKFILMKHGMGAF